MKTNPIKTILVGLALAGTVFLVAPASAEGARGHHGGKMNSEKMVQRMTEKLNLNPDQAARIKSIADSHQSRFQEIGSQMKSTFTDAQREAMKDRRKNRKGNASGEKPSKEEWAAKRAEWMRELGISQGQMDQIKSLRQQMKAEREMMKNEIAAVLTPEQKAQMEQMKKDRKGKRWNRGERGGRSQ